MVHFFYKNITLRIIIKLIAYRLFFLELIFYLFSIKFIKNIMINIILFGPPGSGKGTQSVKISKKYNLSHLSTGDIFRTNIKNKTNLGKKAIFYINKGNLVPDDITLAMLKNEFNSFKNTNGFIFDGFPRTIFQANNLDEFLKSKNTNVSSVISLEVDEIELTRRLLLRGVNSKRDDDIDKDVIKNRIEVYKKETFILKNYYDSKEILSEVNGIGSIDEIFKNISDKLDLILE